VIDFDYFQVDSFRERSNEVATIGSTSRATIKLLKVTAL